MMKKYSWIAALVLALTFAFAGCSGTLEKDDDDDGPADAGFKENENPIVKDATFFKLSGRVNDYDTIDIRAGKANNLSDWTTDKKHTITVNGRANKSWAAHIRFANTDSPYAKHSGDFDTDGDGLFKMEREFEWAEISAATQNIRIQVDSAAKTVYIYEIVIKDEAGKTVYQLSKDDDIQDLDNGDNPFPQGDQSPTTWLAQAGSPKIIVIVPGEEVPVDPVDPPGAGNYFDDAVGITIPYIIWGSGDSLVFDATTKVLQLDRSGSQGSALFGLDWPTAGTGDNIVITYACVNESDDAAPKVTAKQGKDPTSTAGADYTDLDAATYPDFATGEVKTLKIPVERYDADKQDYIFFQDNSYNNTGAKWKLKIISVVLGD